MLWLSLFFPQLPLEVFTRGEPVAPPQAIAIYESRGNRQWIHACSPAARDRGIRPGMALGAATSLSDRLRVHVRDPDAEGRTLEALALWAGQFTPVISLHPPTGLLLEIEASLRLFGGVAPLRERIAYGLEALGHDARLAVAPTPAGSWLLARAGHTEAVLDRRGLNAALRPLALRLLELPESLHRALRGVGLRRLGDLMRLPRAGLSRRFGPELVEGLDRVLGRAPDPRPHFAPPARFSSHLPLPAEIANSEALLFPIRRLLLELEGFLLGRGGGVQSFVLELWHEAIANSRLEIGLVAPGRDPAHLLALVRENLDRHPLPAPVEAISLHADRVEDLDIEAGDLFTPSAGGAGQDWQGLVERLRARLGSEAVAALGALDEHRPERAWRIAEPGTKAPSPSRALPRPTWLLEPPSRLQTVGGRPHLNGKLVLRQGPERIESGWWDGADVARDYFIAENPQHARFWIYREPGRPDQWFLHGVFG